jgi:DNA-directed RNA polymerase subunit L
MASIRLTEEQLRIIQEALDFYSRVGIGQFNVIKEHPTFENQLKKEFTDEEKLEFADYIVESKRETSDDDSNEFVPIIPNFREELSVDDISELIEKFQVRYN